MAMNIDQNKLNELIKCPLQPAAANELRRCNNVFFVGGELPIDETLVTMFESFCTESTELFHLSFGAIKSFPNSEEMARQIKKNFNIRLMGRLNSPASAQALERIYAVGVDILDIPLVTFDHSAAKKRDYDRSARYDALMSARPIFPRWSVSCTLLAGEEPPVSTMNGIDELLKDGIVPLVAIAESAADVVPGPLAAIFEHLASGWKTYHVPIQPFLPIINYMTPLTPNEPPGLLRGIVDKLHDRRRLVASDLRRHLRLKIAEDSMDSAAL
jgi:hypothetical protein